MVRNYSKRNEPRRYAALATLEASIIASFFVAACGGGDHDQSAIPDYADGAAGASASPSPDAGTLTSQPIDDHIRRIIEEEGTPLSPPPDGGADADADLRGVGGNDPDDAGLFYPTVNVCGDGDRDVVAEECDDDNADNTDACLDTCRVRDMRVLEDTGSLESPLPNRYLGEGRHPVAAGASGFAVAFIETVSDESSPDLNPTVVLTHFGPAGARDMNQRTILSSDTTPVLFADPVVAALPSGAYAVAWTDFDGDGDVLGIALRRAVPGASPTLSSVRYANASALFSQSEPDMLWTGEELIVGWVDDTDLATAPDIRYRRFDENLTPLDNADQLLAASAAVEDGLAFAPFKGGWAAAWRETSASDGKERVVVRHAALTWQTDFFWPGPADDKPAMMELDGSHLFVVFTVGTDPWGDGIYDIPKLYGAILDTDTPGTVTAFALFPSGDPLVQKVDESHPNAIRVSVGTNTRFYVTRRLEITTNEEDLMLQEYSWNAMTEALQPVGTGILLPRITASNLGAQRFPSLAASPLAPQGAIVAAWDDLYAETDPATQGKRDVLVELIPVPIIRNP